MALSTNTTLLHERGSIMRNKIKEYLACDCNFIVGIHNEYCDANNDPDARIYCMDELDEILDGKTPTQILMMMHFGNFNPMDEYFRFDGYGNLESTDFPENWIYLDDIVDYIIDNNDSLNDDRIEEILTEEA